MYQRKNVHLLGFGVNPLHTVGCESASIGVLDQLEHLEMAR
jgi:hypothetical protein